jgi:hypothetical protein
MAKPRMTQQEASFWEKFLKAAHCLALVLAIVDAAGSLG